MENGKFLQLKTTEGQTLYVKPEAIGALEIVPQSARVEGHIKLYVGGYKFLIEADEGELLQKLNTKGE